MSRLIEVDSCERCGALSDLRQFRLRWLCDECIGAERTARAGPL